ncbi:thiopeptide-type bacteriocin biosynthesis protein [Promicromonospora sp. NPDC023805]|uniref:thiopeptide-type bacteriocin biosynthesis protein n=1 Tax=Promicromonospora sp. NPDC023805 TaxID=3154696 RepID=UPI0033F1B18F
MIRTEHETTERAVLTYLFGEDLAVAARAADMSPAHLASIAERYRAAGRSTIDLDPQGWAQVDVEFGDYADAERAFRDELWPTLQTKRWWFVRKNPHWRLRYFDSGPTDFPDDLRSALDSMTARGTLQHWRPAVYEPETAAFGGPAGLQAVNDIHAADSTGLLTFLDARGTNDKIAPRLPVTSLMVLAHLMRSTGLEWEEQGDVWARVMEQRPEAPITDQRVGQLALKARSALTVDLTPLIRDDPSFAALSTWATVMHDAGRRLAAVAADGALQTGLRTVLARTVLFCWNRAGFTTDQQSVWSLAARRAVLGMTR